MPKLEGSCLCGQVAYSCDAEPQLVAVCHCENCQKQTGTALSVIVGVPASSVVFQNKDSLKEFLDRGDSGKPVHRHFCGDCGSPILSVVEATPDLEYIKAGTLKDRSWLKPTVHLWCDTAQPWVEIDPSAQHVPRG